MVRCETGPSLRVRTRAHPVQYILHGDYKRGLHAFKADKDIMDVLVHLRGRGRGEATTGEPALATSLWGMLYADDAGVVSQSPEQLQRIMGGRVRGVQPRRIESHE